MSILEVRYRRLISLFPAAHRHRYQDEMLSTLMDGASEQQQSPGWRESVDLIWNALRLRLNPHELPRARDPRWASACMVFAVLASLTASALAAAGPLGTLSISERFFPDPTPYGIFWVPFAFAGGWLLVAALVLAGWRRLAVNAAWLTAALFGWHLFTLRTSLEALVTRWPLLILALIIAGSLSFTRGAEPIRKPLRGLLFGFSAIAVAAGASLWIDAKLTRMVLLPDSTVEAGWGGNFPILPGSYQTVGAVPVLIYVMTIAFLVLVLTKVDGPVRRRLIALTLPPLATWVLVVRAYPHGLNTVASAHWLVLVLTPTLILAIGILLVRWSDPRSEEAHVPTDVSS